MRGTDTSLRRVLIVHTGGGLGDLLLSSPIAAAVRRHVPDAQITWWASPAHAPVLENLPAADRLWTQSPGDPLRVLVRMVRTSRYDAAILPWTTGRQAWTAWLADIPIRVGQSGRLWYSFLFTHPVSVRSTRDDVTSHWVDIQLDYARALGFAGEGLAPEVRVADHERQTAAERLASLGVERGRPYCVLHIGKGLPIERVGWPTSRFTEIGGLLAREYGWPVVLTGTVAERGRVAAVATGLGPSAVDVAGKTTLRELCAVVEGAEMCVATDGGVTHVAAAVGTPIVGLFAIKSDVVPRWRPHATRARTVGTGEWTCDRRCTKERCADFACIGHLDVAGVRDAVASLLQETRADRRANAVQVAVRP